MASSPPAGRVAERLDKLYEFEREPVAHDKLHGSSRFAGVYAGEHVAATEFVIGALFVSWGTKTSDVLYGLLLGNLAAVVSWACVCAPLATETRLTLYWYLRRIAGPAVTSVYNVLNAILYCILAGSMITVSASAVRIPFGIPAQTHWYPDDMRFVLVVLAVGAVVTILAVWGFKRLAQFASICSPWMILIFVAGALATLPALAASIPQVGSVRSASDFLAVADARIWTGVTAGGGERIGFWHVAAFAWICNIAMHLGLSDMAIFRYARRWTFGFNSAYGMFLGHYLAWITAGVMGAAAAHAAGQSLTLLDSGAVAYYAAGGAGAIAVIVAGWTTANPTLYRAGLALQAITPNWPRWRVTLVAGIITTIVACSPFVFTKLLDFVGTYGVLLAPVGGVVTAEHWLFPRLSLHRFWASGKTLNAPALIAWAVASLGALVLSQTGAVHLFFLAVPAWIVAGLLYTALAALAGAGKKVGVDAAAVSATGSRETVARGDTAVEHGAPDAATTTAGALAVVFLAGCLALPLWVFAAPPEAYVARLDLYKSALLWMTVGYFVAATYWITRKPTTR
ncbi:MAG: nucleoside transporter [Planctomycetota bacterium]